MKKLIVLALLVLILALATKADARSPWCTYTVTNDSPKTLLVSSFSRELGATPIFYVPPFSTRIHQQWCAWQ